LIEVTGATIAPRRSKKAVHRRLPGNAGMTVGIQPGAAGLLVFPEAGIGLVRMFPKVPVALNLNNR